MIISTGTKKNEHRVEVTGKPISIQPIRPETVWSAIFCSKMPDWPESS